MADRPTLYVCDGDDGGVDVVAEGLLDRALGFSHVIAGAAIPTLPRTCPTRIPIQT